MCHILLHICTPHAHPLRIIPINCGKGVFVFPPYGDVIECPDFPNAWTMKEARVESACRECLAEEKMWKDMGAKGEMWKDKGKGEGVVEMVVRGVRVLVGNGRKLEGGWDEERDVGFGV